MCEDSACVSGGALTGRHGLLHLGASDVSMSKAVPGSSTFNPKMKFQIPPTKGTRTDGRDHISFRVNLSGLFAPTWIWLLVSLSIFSLLLSRSNMMDMMLFASEASAQRTWDPSKVTQCRCIVPSGKTLGGCTTILRMYN